jgi:phosphoglycolate phosphatase
MSGIKKPHMMLIDLDGTLVDSVPDLAAAIDAMQHELNQALRGEAKVRTWVGNGVERLVKRALTDALDGEPDADLYAQALPIFQRFYDRYNGQASRAYPGVREGLQWLQSQDIRLGCITNKSARFTVPLLNSLRLSDFFEIIISGDTLPVKKPDPAPLLHAVKHFGMNVNMACMLGDSKTDVTAARNAAFGAVICVNYGYNHGEDIHLAHPDAVISSFEELPMIISL